MISNSFPSDDIFEEIRGSKDQVNTSLNVYLSLSEQMMALELYWD